MMDAGKPVSNAGKPMSKGGIRFGKKAYAACRAAAVLAVAALVYFIFLAIRRALGEVAYNVRSMSHDLQQGSVPRPSHLPDWIELQNTSGERINLTGYGLSDDKLSPAKWAFPAGTHIEPNGYLVVWCSGDAAEGSLFAGFKLAATDDLVLLDPSGRPVDSLALTSVPSGSSLGRDVVTGMWGTLTDVPPGYPNTPEGRKPTGTALQNAMWTRASSSTNSSPPTPPPSPTRTGFFRLGGIVQHDERAWTYPASACPTTRGPCGGSFRRHGHPGKGVFRGIPLRRGQH